MIQAAGVAAFALVAAFFPETIYSSRAAAAVINLSPRVFFLLPLINRGEGAAVSQLAAIVLGVSGIVATVAPWLAPIE